ncbi:MAG: CHASE2 domain-containing protein [Alphaproteobacteria bacterium]|nr:CHASE2 domain-containing protein [Alphaproteobacteria bacterium]
MRLTKGISLLVSAACAVLAVVLSLIGAAPVWLDGLLFDGALGVRSRLIEEPAPAARVAVVAVDPASLASKELASLPRAFFGPVWGQLITDLTMAGATVVAFDFLLPYSANQFQRGYDRPFMAALFRNRQRVVLGRSSRTQPARNYIAALRNDPGALGFTEVFAEPDEIHRKIPTSLSIDDKSSVATLLGASLSRAGVKSFPGDILLAPGAHPESLVPTYGIAAVLRCAKEDPGVLKAAFKDRIVFVGSTMPEEDRKIASSRFIAPQAARPNPKADCGLQKLRASVSDADDVPGVHLHAVAGEAVLSGRMTLPAAPHWTAAVSGMAALAGAAAGFLLAPLWAIAAVIVVGFGLWLGEIGLLSVGLWLPVGLGILSVAGAAVIAYLVRFVLEEGKRRRIQNAFGFYLAPSLVDRLVETAEDLHLGGEKRDVTIMFADLSGFTALSGLVGPEELVARTNEYLTLIVDEVEATGGYVDKFIGDAVMAIWGAPVALEDNAGAAVEAAIRISERIAEKRDLATAAGEHGFAVKVGVNSGDAVVGNVGSEKRFNYTAVGEAVNIAARLEGLPSVYDCWIVLGESMADRVRGRYEMRELDMVAVKGKAEPLRIYEPLGGAEVALKQPYADALALYRAQNFDGAVAIWDGLDDGPSKIMAERARIFQDSPPPRDWDGVWVMTSK